MAELTQDQQEYKEHQEEMGRRLLEMSGTEGWKVIKQYYEQEVKAYATALLTGEEPTEEYDRGRWELHGMRKLFNFVDSSIGAFKDERDAGAPKE